MPQTTQKGVPLFHPLGNGTRNMEAGKRNTPLNTGGTAPLKALAAKVLRRNAPWNARGTRPQNSGTRAEYKAVQAERNTPTRWDAEIAATIEWFLATAPPAEPFQLHPGVWIAHPARWWASLRDDIAVGPGKGRAYYGALQKDLRRIAELFGGPGRLG